jgi:selenocysteine lyase/cysteine desulfurase
MAVPFDELKRAVRATLETYANVHRGSGHCSMATTRLYEEARNLVREHLDLRKADYEVVFCSPDVARLFLTQLPPGGCKCLSSADFGLALGVRALAIHRWSLSRLSSHPVGGGTARLVGPRWVVWARTPARFEAGTPAIVNVITLAKALRLARRHGNDCLRHAHGEPASPADIIHHDALDGLSGHELLARLKASRIGRELRVPTAAGESLHVNLDHAASTMTFEPIWEAVWRTWQLPAQAQQVVVQEAARVCADFLHAPADDYEVLFTANTTEAINLAAENLGARPPDGNEPVVLNTVLEHNSNELPWRKSATRVQLDVDAQGFVKLAELEAELAAYNRDGRHGKQRICLVAVSGASNVIGSCNDLGEICKLAHRYGAEVLVDAAQLVAHRKLDVLACDVDYLAFSAHKAYAPFGSGALVARKGLLRLGQDRLAQIRASGEENAGGIAGLAKALTLLGRVGLDLIQAEEQALTAQALRGMAEVPWLKVHGIASPEDPRFAQRSAVIAFQLRGSLSYKIAGELAERAGIASRWGCHCAHMLIKRLHHLGPKLQQFQRVLVTLAPRLELPGLARVSFGLANEPADIQLLIETLGQIGREGRIKRKALKKRMNDFVTGTVQRVFGDETSVG